MLGGGRIKGAFALPVFFFSTNNILQGAKQGDIDRRQSGCGYKLSLLHRFDRGCCDRDEFLRALDHFERRHLIAGRNHCCRAKSCSSCFCASISRSSLSCFLTVDSSAGSESTAAYSVGASSDGCTLLQSIRLVSVRCMSSR
jgi:hypothetical protein